MERLCMGCMEKYDDSFSVCPHCGYVFNTPPEQSYHIEPGSVLAQRYIVGKVLGFGGFGVTYLGWDYVMERKVAIKEYLPSEFATRMPTQQKVTVYSGDKEEQFKEGLIKTLDEARRLAKFETVSGVVQIYDCFEANGTSYIIMEYLEGMSLKKYLEEKGKMTVEQASSVILQVAMAMEEVHKEGILHRDIAPDNIYVLNPDEPDNLRVKLLDFGAARYATTKHSKSLSVIIKPGYAPEEQYRSRGDQGTWTDVYALAATLYKMLTGVTPEDAMERSVKDEVKRPGKMGVKISKPMETALMNALNVKIADRTQTMEEFSKELMAAEVKERRATKTKTDVGSVPKWVFALAAVGVAAVAGVGIWVATGHFQARWGASRLEANMVRMPNVIGIDADEAETLLEADGIQMNKDRAAYSDERAENQIYYQGVKENSQIEKGTQVPVWISLGEKPGTIPNIRGVLWEEAEKELREAGFDNIKVVESQEEGVYDQVLELSEEAGASVSLKKEITVTVCKNEASLKESDGSEEQVKVPDLAGLTQEQAKKALEEAGLRFYLREEASDTVEKGFVISQGSEAGGSLGKGSYVEVVVSLGKETVNIDLENVLYMPQEKARAALFAQGFSVGEISEEYSSTTPGSVSRITDANGNEIKNQTQLEKGAEVNLVVSLGPKPTEAPVKTTEAAPPPTTEAPPQTTAAPPTTEAAPPPTTEAPPPTEAPPTEAPPTEAPPTEPPPTEPPPTEAPPAEAPQQAPSNMPDIDF